MKTGQQLLTPTQLSEMFWYDSIKGDLIRRVASGRWGRFEAGTVVGTPTRDGYLSVRVAGTNYLVHRVAFAIAHNEWPHGQVDHIDGNRRNNRLINLRDVAPSENSQNRHNARFESATGIIGVRQYRGRWNAVIRVNGVRTYLGTYDTAAEARTAYVAAKLRLHPFWSGERQEVAA